ncbi:hypothetical protein PHYSODRAFT_305839 [Phytophthora sojae]|uniref:M96 mating-specific protein family n=1 Tax=Phytophthora sojae (strain P6497) TaxID=1094619 RepID=G5A6U2_PHYSP|nr:hypothetical protein PHYSODRAFT_305839 [Phytophthora sojae]EGZ09047.1 hypothetical protein PHYSODRAFT_305839 [Phytophthora sojae]|eukprot:XP_009535680.1 hypothetical protein PHYSODRAFT_305839 [Phytophthora sojae]
MASDGFFEDVAACFGTKAHQEQSPQSGEVFAVSSELSTNITSVSSCGTLGDTIKTRKEKEALRKRQYHHRLRAERDTLRREVDELTLQLQRLKQTQAGRSLAIYERHQHVIAETEQILLFAAARAQAAHIETYHGHQSAASVTTTPVDSILQAPARSSFDQILFVVHLRGLESCCARVDQVFRELEMINLPDGVTTTLYRCQDGGGAMQHLNKFVQPYNYEDTHTAIWKLSKLHHRQQDREMFLGLIDDEEFNVIRFRLIRTLADGRNVSVLQRYIIRRRVEKNRTMLVWKTISEGEGYFCGLYMDESGWVCIEPATEEGSTLVRICVRQTPMRFNFCRVPPSVIGEFARVMQSSVEEDMREISSSLDKLQLDATLEGIDI